MMKSVMVFEGIGLKGDVVTVSKRIGRLKLLPANVATYPTSENVARVQEELLVSTDISSAAKVAIYVYSTSKNVVWVREETLVVGSRRVRCWVVDD